MLEDGLAQRGVDVLGVKEATWAVPRALERPPDLMLVDRHLPVLSGPEIVRALRAFPQTLDVPVAFVTADDSPGTLVRSVRAGAVDVLHKPVDEALFARIVALLGELRSRTLRGSPSPAAQAQVLLGVFRRQARTGLLQLNAGTPFEGRALFLNGALHGASFGPLDGPRALEEMITLEEGGWSFDPAQIEWPSPPAAAEPDLVELAAPARPRLLLVDDDADLRVLFSTQLRRAGFDVALAEDGVDGLQRARGEGFDLIVADLNMPRLDGWGFLRELRADLRTREVPVIFLSAHDDYRETLKAARSGAWDYLPKTGRADALIGRCLAALEPRRAALSDLQLGIHRELDLRVLGPRWVLATLSTLRASGALQAEDDWAKYRFTLRDGDPVSAHVQSPGKSGAGAAALGALLLSRNARARFTPGVIEERGQFNVSMPQLLDTAAEVLNALEARMLSARLAAGARVDVDPPLYDLYRRVCAERDLRVARALCEQRLPPGELPALLGMPPEEVEAAVTDLLRRGVVRVT